MSELGWVTHLLQSQMSKKKVGFMEPRRPDKKNDRPSQFLAGWSVSGLGYNPRYMCLIGKREFACHYDLYVLLKKANLRPKWPTLSEHVLLEFLFSYYLYCLFFYYISAFVAVQDEIRNTISKLII